MSLKNNPRKVEVPSYEDAMENTQQTVSLGVKKARRFFETLAEHPFVCVVVADSEIRIFSSAIEDDELAAIRDMMSELNEGE